MASWPSWCRVAGIRPSSDTTSGSCGIPESTLERLSVALSTTTVRTSSSRTTGTISRVMMIDHIRSRPSMPPSPQRPRSPHIMPDHARSGEQKRSISGMGPRGVAAFTGLSSRPLWTNADDCLSVASLGRVEGRNRIVEGRDVADVRPQPSVTHPPDDLTQLGAIGLDNKVDRQTVRGPRLGRPDDGHQRSSGPNQTRGPLLDVAADDVEHQVDAADVFQNVVLKVDELHRTEAARLLTVHGASS